ncbi:MAG: RNA methyltransferase, partial [Terricaulis sp.]
RGQRRFVSGEGGQERNARQAGLAVLLDEVDAHAARHEREERRGLSGGDPGNLGTILRTADSTGASGVILVGESCDPFSVEAVRASMGSLFAMKLARASFEDLLRFRKERGAQMMGLSLKGAAFEADRPAPTRAIIFMGNEQSGLPAHMEEACDALVKLPMRGRADSLNLAIATGVMLYDLWRRRGYDGARA